MKATFVLGAALACIVLATQAQETKKDYGAAERPYRSFDSKPAIVAGPLALDVSDTSVAIVWMTDAPGDARVRIDGDGATREVIPETDGLVPVGTLHRVVVDGLKPGTHYRYRALSRQVVAMKPYWPDRGGTAESPPATFTALDPARASVRLAVITDTHDDAARTRDLLGVAQAAGVDFVAHAGDSMDHADSQLQVRDGFFGPAADGLRGGLPLLYARGNHETRGAFARTLSPWLHAPEGGYAFARRHGPLELFVVDTGEDKPDDVNVYAGLNRMREYRARELEWFRHALQAPPAAPFRVVLAHQPEWGADDIVPDAWTQAANAGRVDLMIAGHLHRHAWWPAGDAGRKFSTLVVGQDQVAIIDADAAQIRVRLLDRGGKALQQYAIPRATR